ncbi:MAG TPA: hypothetical protein VE077_21360, partial [Candidatus Methylomirabilis sp.]|nr:hypothetical protein [Candidatus Methylomirabilis sp.]
IWGDDEGAGWEKQDGPWPFNDVPREMRLRAVDKIPEVITELNKAAVQTAKKIQEKTEKVLDLAEAITQVVNSGKAKESKPSRIAAAFADAQKSPADTGKLSEMAHPVKLGAIVARDDKEGSE